MEFCSYFEQQNRDSVPQIRLILFLVIRSQILNLIEYTSGSPVCPCLNCYNKYLFLMFEFRAIENYEKGPLSTLNCTIKMD